MRDDPEADFHRVQELFLEACELDDARRERFLTELARTEPGLHAQVRDLLARDAGSDSLVRVGVSHEIDLALDDGATIGIERIGPYRVVELLGRGGMGIVYRARQQNPERDVAIKVLRPGLTDATSRRRFEAEVAALGRLDHPGIARIFDVGTTDLGFGAQAYIVMELVEGESLRSWAQGREREDVLALFARVCRAVAHANERGVVHRDLKPDNVLVDERGDPRVLDFGLARVVDPEQGRALFTSETGQVAGTLAYMSPEQVASDSGRMDARTDVYALGVVLYELLCDGLPYELGSLSLPQAARTILHTPPREPRTRSGVPLPKDLRTILGKALEKEPERRYRDAEALGAEIERFLHHEPIHARPASRLYRLSRFARRNRALVAGTLSTTFVLLVAVVGLSMLSLELTRSESAANRRTEVVESAFAYLDQVLGSVDPARGGAASGRDVRVADVLDDARDHLGEGFDGLPESEAAVRAMLGGSYRSLQLFEDSEREYLAARELLEREAPDDPILLNALRGLANLYTDTGRYEEALELALATVERTVAIEGPRSEAAYERRTAVVYALWELGRAEEACDYLEPWLEPCRSDLGEESPITLDYFNSMGVLLSHLGRREESIEILREVCALHEHVLGPEHPETLNAKLNLATAIRKLSPLSDELRRETLETAREVFEARHRIMGPEHTHTLWGMGFVCDMLAQDGRYEESAELRAQQLAVIEGAGLQENRVYHHALGRAVGALVELERYGEAEEAARASLAGNRTIHEEGAPLVLQARMVLARVLLRRGDPNACLEELEGVPEALAAAFPEGDRVFAEVDELRGQSLIDLGRPSEAREFLVRSHEGFARLLGEGSDPARRLRAALDSLTEPGRSSGD